MNRKQLYEEIVSLNLQEEVKAKYGKNYTMCSNAALQAIVDEVHTSMYAADAAQCGYRSLQALVEILAKKNILLKSEVEKIWKA